jgi:hypothetical protein
MDEDHNHPERLRSETPSFQAQQPQERTGSMSLGMKPPTDDAPAAVNGDAAKSEAPPPAQPDPDAEKVINVINSEVSVWVREKSGIVLTFLSDWSTDTAQPTEAEYCLCKGKRKALLIIQYWRLTNFIGIRSLLEEKIYIGGRTCEWSEEDLQDYPRKSSPARAPSGLFRTELR